MTKKEDVANYLKKNMLFLKFKKYFITRLGGKCVIYPIVF